MNIFSNYLNGRSIKIKKDDLRAIFPISYYVNIAGLVLENTEKLTINYVFFENSKFYDLLNKLSSKRIRLLDFSFCEFEDSGLAFLKVQNFLNNVKTPWKLTLGEEIKDLSFFFSKEKVGEIKKLNIN